MECRNSELSSAAKLSRVSWPHIHHIRDIFVTNVYNIVTLCSKHLFFNPKMFGFNARCPLKGHVCKDDAIADHADATNADTEQEEDTTPGES